MNHRELSGSCEIRLLQRNTLSFAELSGRSSCTTQAVLASKYDYCRKQWYRKGTYAVVVECTSFLYHISVERTFLWILQC